jgi:hypothetical protein
MWLVKAERGRKIAETANSTPLRHVKCGIYNEYVVFVPDAAKKIYIFPACGILVPHSSTKTATLTTVPVCCVVVCIVQCCVLLCCVVLCVLSCLVFCCLVFCCQGVPCLVLYQRGWCVMVVSSLVYLCHFGSCLYLPPDCVCHVLSCVL